MWAWNGRWLTGAPGATFKVACLSLSPRSRTCWSGDTVRPSAPGEPADGHGKRGHRPDGGGDRVQLGGAADHAVG
jgi:hypothetical protein